MTLGMCRSARSADANAYSNVDVKDQMQCLNESPFGAGGKRLGPRVTIPQSAALPF